MVTFHRSWLLPLKNGNGSPHNKVYSCAAMLANFLLQPRLLLTLALTMLLILMAVAMWTRYSAFYNVRWVPGSSKSGTISTLVMILIYPPPPIILKVGQTEFTIYRHCPHLDLQRKFQISYNTVASSIVLQLEGMANTIIRSSLDLNNDHLPA